MNGERLYRRYAYNDLIRNKGVNLALLVILTLSAFLMATGAMVIERLAGAVEGLFEQAQPPHFLQMHKGEYDAAALDAFAAEHPEIDSWLIEDMLGYDGSAISWSRPGTGESGDLGASSIDNLFVTQNESFDFLVDKEGGIPEPAPGEVYVPVKYAQSDGLAPGDVLTLRTDQGAFELDVVGVVKDAQMASSLSQSTRFLISERDFGQLSAAGGAAPEIIAEYRLADPGGANAFQAAYEANGALPKNGPVVTYDQVQIIHTLSDGLSAIALIFVSLLLIVIAVLNLRFVIRGTLEDEVREIGAMKAIGIPNRVISGMYLAKYSALTVLACVIGGILAIVGTGLLTRNLQASYAPADVGVATVLAPLAALAAVFVVVVAICRRVLRGVKKIEVVNSLVHGSTLTEKQAAKRAARQARWVKRTGLASASGRNMNRRLALLDLRAEGGQWVLVPIVFFLAAVLVTLPTNLLTTFESPKFITYTGQPERDLLVAVQYQDDVDGVRQDLLTALEGDSRLAGVQQFATVPYRTQGAEGLENLPVTIGDHSETTIQFAEGGPPRTGQIALSVLNANDHGLGVGDPMTLELSGTTTEVEVSGIYQDITAGGKTAKMPGDPSATADVATAFGFYADVADGSAPEDIAAELTERFPTAFVISMADYQAQTLAYLTDAVRSAAWLALIFGVGVAMLVVSLFLKLRLTQDRSKMGVLSAIGFATNEIVAQVRMKTVFAAGAGILLGLVFAATAGEALAGGVFAGVGIAALEFIPNPWLVYVLYPLLLLGAGYLGVVLLTAGFRNADKSQWLR